MSSPSATSIKPKKVVVPKVWKRPHSTIYGKNVEFGSSLYSDKLGEINGRKFNSELPWQVRNSSGGGSSFGAGGTSSTQRYISSLLDSPESTLLGSVASSSSPAAASSGGAGGSGSSSSSGGSGSANPIANLDRFAGRCQNYSDLLDLTNPNRCSQRRFRLVNSGGGNNGSLFPDKSLASRHEKPIDFYAKYNADFLQQIERFERDSLLRNEPLLTRRIHDNFLDFDFELGLFVPAAASGQREASSNGKCLLSKTTLANRTHANCANLVDSYHNHKSCGGRCHSHRDAPNDELPNSSLAARGATQINSCNCSNTCSLFSPVISLTKQTDLLPRHCCQLSSSPYGQSADGRKLSLGSINPHSYRPSLPQKSSTVHSSDGEEFEFHDRSSPFYTDR